MKKVKFEFSFFLIVSLVVLCAANNITKEMIRECYIGDSAKLLNLLKNMKKMTKMMTFKQPYHVYFEKKKIEVFCKINEFIMDLLIDIFSNKAVDPEYQSVIS